jgi:hypothetical protein
MVMINRYDPIISSASRRFGVPEERIRAVMGVESGGRADAVSPKGAAGLMQVMAPTYQDLAKRHGLGPDRFDPTNNIFAGTAYLGEMYDQFGNWDEATQAYNMGPGRAMRVRNGTATVPAETAAYLPKVNAALGIFDQGQGGDVAPGLTRPRPGQTSGMGPMFGAARPGQSLTGLLEVDDENNFYEGLGGLLNVGQEPSQPPRTDPAALPGTTQTDRAPSELGAGLGINDRLNGVMQQLLDPKTQRPQMSQGGYMMAGALGAVSPLAGVRDRKVGIGELLGALGGGLTRGAMAGEEARQQRLGSEFDNLYKFASAKKALAPTSDADRYKVVGKQVYDTQTKQFIQSPGGVDQSGPLEGTGIDAQMYNTYVTLSQKQVSGQPLNPQETMLLQLSERHLMKPRVVPTANGGFAEVSPQPLPGMPQPAPAPQSPPPGPAVTSPPAQPPGAQPPPNPRVTQLREGAPTPNNEQSLAAGFANRLNAANSTFDQLEAKGWTGPGALERNLGNVPLLGNYAMSDEYQQYDQAKREFINAQLRRESGAAIGESEFENADKQYFPQPGDSEAVLKQKRQAREMAVRNMVKAAGPAKPDFEMKPPGGDAPDPLGIRR